MLTPTPRPLAPKSTPCNDASSVIANLASKLGLGLNPSDVSQLVNAITAGGTAGMALAQYLADQIAGANYVMGPQLTTTINSALNQPVNRNLLLTSLVRLHLARSH